MGNQITRQDSGTRSSSVSLKAEIPSWINLADLDSCFPTGYAGRLPAGAGQALRNAADAHDVALQPDTSADRQKVLLGLRTSTIIRREDEAEATATLDMLRVHLEDVPLDILQAACRAYCNAPGQRFFPRSAGELRVYTNPLVHERRSRAFRLRWLAEQADREDAERARLADDPLTPEAAAAIRDEFGIGKAPDRSAPPPKRATGTAAEPTVADYLDLGLTEDEARQAIADRQRMLARGKGKPVGGSAEAIVKGLAA